MATRTRTQKGTTYESKSDHARALFKAGATIAEVTRQVPNMGYAFAYGVASRMPHPDGGTYAERAANRRATKTVARVGDEVHVRIVTDGEYVGTVIVDSTTGKVRKTK